MVNRQSLLLTVLTAAHLAAGYKWPSPLYDSLEGFLFEGRRRDGSNMATLQHPCKVRTGTQASIGAEWLRLAYHDVATHNIETGTGGLDASIAFELDRAEPTKAPRATFQNFGIGMVHSLDDFETFSTKYLSRADIIAFGTVFAVASCGGPIISFRGGRIDALSADVAGVPEPHQDLETHIEIFRRQGFSQEEMISLVACGHTLGGVRSSDFPNIVTSGDNPAVDNFELFDTTSQFDNAVVTEYVAGSTLNPLVVDTNATLNSDLRIFSSDDNATMRKLADPDVFSSTCATLLERMLNTVPSTVTLTEPITMIPAKVTSAQLTIDQNELIFKTAFRLSEPSNARNSKRIVTMYWCDRYGPDKDCVRQNVKTALPATSPRRDETTGSPILQRTGLDLVHHEFVVPINPDESISMFWFEVDEQDGARAKRYDNEGEGYKIAQDTIIYAPRLSSVTFSGAQRTQRQFVFVAGVKTGITPSRVFLSAFDNAMPDYAAPLNADFEMVFNDTIPAAAGYEFYTAIVDDSGSQLTIDLHAVVDDAVLTEDYQQTFFIAARTPFNRPTNVTIVRQVSPPSGPTSGSSHTWDLLRLEVIMGLLLAVTLLT
ncbi:heme peroxidase [Coprinopsis marcescibilis]|uniref:Peroxidase n=1 Tax=Coprinopsis marcescibilis TaxID=230819 RepID=A0A5C3LBR3_COPMA|nr:heme peroxidase [Coprinopsis marcescibilis]